MASFCDLRLSALLADLRDLAPALVASSWQQGAEGRLAIRREVASIVREATLLQRNLAVRRDPAPAAFGA